MQLFTVIGLYADNSNRFTQSYQVESAADAEAEALTDHPDLIVAGVAAGDIDMVA